MEDMHLFAATCALIVEIYAMRSLLQKFETNPKFLFLTDGVGAMVSAFLLGVILVRFEAIFGIPKSMLFLLAILPLFFAMFDFYAFKSAPDRYSRYFKVIASLNVAYCFLSIGLAFYHSEVVTYWGWGYIIGEVMIISVLIYLELKMV